MEIDWIVIGLVCFSLLQILGFFLLRKKSFHSLSFLILLLLSISSLCFYLIGSTGASLYYWTIPFVFLLAVVLLWFYYHQFAANISNAIVHIKQLAVGDFNMDSLGNKPKNEFGILNDSILLLSVYLNRIVFEVHHNSESMDYLLGQLKILLNQMAEGEKDQEANLKKTSADMKEVIALLERLFQVDEKTDVQLLLPDKKSTSNQFSKVSYSDITSTIDSTAMIITLINILSHCVDIEASRTSNMQGSFKGAVIELEKIAEQNKRLSKVCAHML